MTLYGFKSREVRDALISVGEGTAGLPDIPIPSREEFRPHKAKILTAVASSTITPSRLNEDETELLAGQGEVCIVTRNKNQDPGTWSPRLNAEGEPLLIPVYNFSNRIHLVEQVLEAGDVVNVDTALVRVVQDTYGNWYVLENDPRPFLVRSLETISFGSDGECRPLTGEIKTSKASESPSIIGHNRFKRPRINKGDECLAVWSQTETEPGYVLITYGSEGQGSVATTACSNAQSGTFAESIQVDIRTNPPNFFAFGIFPFGDWDPLVLGEHFRSVVDGEHTLDYRPDIAGFVFGDGSGRSSLWTINGGIADCNRWKNLATRLTDNRGVTHQFEHNMLLRVTTSGIDFFWSIYQESVVSGQKTLVDNTRLFKTIASNPDMGLLWDLDFNTAELNRRILSVIVNPASRENGVGV